MKSVQELITATSLQIGNQNKRKSPPPIFKNSPTPPRKRKRRGRKEGVEGEGGLPVSEVCSPGCPLTAEEAPGGSLPTGQRIWGLHTADRRGSGTGEAVLETRARWRLGPDLTRGSRPQRGSHSQCGRRAAAARVAGSPATPARPHYHLYTTNPESRKVSMPRDKKQCACGPENHVHRGTSSTQLLGANYSLQHGPPHSS